MDFKFFEFQNQHAVLRKLKNNFEKTYNFLIKKFRISEFLLLRKTSK